ncbi:MAG: relaxase/mobilization nuclease domain-containing protein [Clostridia bacterium]|nr:relaxase/mobilization nuclease domain-containing protein [Clostridia bacterium]
MATLANKSIKATLSSVVKYNNNPDKNLPPDGLVAAAAYIRGEHSVERLYSRGHNGCSGNPEVAIEQFRTSEYLYRQKKCGARESGLAEGKVPTIAEHIFLSFPPEENVSYDLQCEIADRLCESDLLKDFYAISNRHYNTDNDHSHILVSNFSKDGSRKLCLNKNKRAELQKELNRICVGYGLSIIDNPALRCNDKEYEAFVRDCVGKVTIYAQKRTTDEFGEWLKEQEGVVIAEGQKQSSYEQWVATHNDFIRAKDKKAAEKAEAVLIAERQKELKAARIYYWQEQFKRNGQYYAVRLYNDDGYRKPLIQLMFELLYLVVTNEEYIYISGKEQTENEKVYWGTNKQLQASYDAMRYAEEQGIRTPSELQARIQAVGIELAEVRQGLAYYSRREDEFAKRKIQNLTEQEERLKKDYRQLKYIENQKAQMEYEIERYIRSGKSLDDLLANAKSRSTQQKNAREYER